MNERGKGIVLGYVYIIIQAAVSFLYTPLLLKGIGQSEYGLYQLAGSIASYMNILESMLTSSSLRFYCKALAMNDDEGAENILGLSRLLYRCSALLISVIGLIVIGLFRVLYRYSLSIHEINEGSFLLAILTANIVMNMLNYTCSVVISANERFAFARFADIFTTLCQPIIVLLVINQYPYAFVITASSMVVNAIAWIIKRIYVKKNIKSKASIHELSWGNIRPLLVFSLSISIGMIADIIFSRTDQLIIGAILGTSAVSVYSIGYTIYSSYNSLGNVVTSVYLPKVSKMANMPNRDNLFLNEMIKTGRLAFFVIMSIIAGFVIYGQEFLILWVGEGYEQAYFVSIVLMIASSIDLLQRLGLTILQVLDKYTFRSIVYVTAAIINIPLTILLTIKFGIVGAAISSSIVLFCSSGLAMNIYYHKKIHLNMLRFWKEMALCSRMLLPIFVCGFITNMINIDNTMIDFVVKIAIYLVVLVFSIYFVMNGEEKDTFNNILHTKPHTN